MRIRKRPAADGTASEALVVFLAGDTGQNSPGTKQPQLPHVVARVAVGDAQVRVVLDEYKGALIVDVRLFEPFTATRTLMPTKKAITLALAKLPELARALADAEATAREMGLL
jgi:hypothetical protein